MAMGSVSNPPGPVVTADIPLPTIGPTPGTGTLLTWTFPGPVPPGNYTLTYTAEVPAFSPDGEVILNEASLTYPQNPTPQIAQAASTVVGNYTVMIDVYNEAGELVKTLPVKQYTQSIPSFSLEPGNTLVSINDKIQIVYKGLVLGTWDGTDNNGGEVTNGKYYIKLDNIDVFGTVTTITQVVKVSRNLAHLTVEIYNEAGEVIRHLDSVTADAVTLSTGVNISAGTIVPSFQGGMNSAVTITLTGGTTLVWDGRNDAGQFVSSGQYFVEVTSNDGQGRDSTITKEINVTSRSTNLTGTPVTVYPNPDSVRVNGSVIYFVANGSTGLTLKVKIYTLAGERVLTDIPVLPGAGFAKWDFTNQAMASGLYLADIEIIDAQGGLQRQITKILIVH
jgi:flagellar hook assembly protein FlgD